jgi:hypothetical protein
MELIVITTLSVHVRIVHNADECFHVGKHFAHIARVFCMPIGVMI